VNQPDVRESLPAPPPRWPAGWRARAFRRALRRRCPQCGAGRLFRAYARLAPTCPACGLAFRREQGAATGSMYVSAAVTELFAATVALGLFWLTDWSVATGLAVGAPLVACFCYAFLPVAIAFWTAVEYATDVAGGEPGLAPRP
jgi:uncharacterized protein (DUF983 family)